MRKLPRFLHQLFVRHDFVDHADAMSLVSIKVVAGQRPPVSVLPTAHRAEQIGRPRDVPDLRLAKHGAIGRDCQVGCERVPEPTAERPAIDGGDDRFAQTPHMRPVDNALAIAPLPILYVIRHRTGVWIGIATALRSHVVARREGIAGPCQNDGPNASISIGLVEGAVKVLLQFNRYGVHAVGAVQSQGDDIALERVDQIVLAHRPSPIATPARSAAESWLAWIAISTATAPCPDAFTMIGFRSRDRNRPAFATANRERLTRQSASASMSAGAAPRA